VTVWSKNIRQFRDAFLLGRIPESDRTELDLSPFSNKGEHLSIGIENAQHHKVDDEVIFWFYIILETSTHRRCLFCQSGDMIRLDGGSFLYSQHWGGGSHLLQFLHGSNYSLVR
jgi:hypothetical protein